MKHHPCFKLNPGVLSVVCLSLQLSSVWAEGPSRRQSEAFLTSVSRCLSDRDGQCLLDDIATDPGPAAAGNSPFELSLSNGIAFDTNPFADSADRSDWHWDSQFQLKYSLPASPGSGWEALVQASLSNSRFDRYTDLDGSIAAVGFEVKNSISEQWEFEIYYDSQWGFGDFLGDEVSSAHSPAIAVTWARPLDHLDIASAKWGLEATLTGGYIFTDPTESECLRISQGWKLVYDNREESATGKHLQAQISATASYYAYSRGDSRSDWRFSAGLQSIWEITQRAALTASVDYTNNFSSLSSSAGDYEQLTVIPSLSLTLSF